MFALTVEYVADECPSIIVKKDGQKAILLQKGRVAIMENGIWRDVVDDVVKDVISTMIANQIREWGAKIL